MIYYFFSGLIFTLVFLKIFIDKISKTKFFRKEERIDSNKKPCIQELHKNKASTPSMGGIAMNGALLVFALVYFFFTKKILWIALILLLYGSLGFIDDYIKLKKIRDGVSPKEKLLGLVIISSVLVVYLYFSHQIIPGIKIPFLSETFTIGIPAYVVLLVILIVASSNGMNIVDGLDGLAAGVSSLALGFIIFYAYRIQSTEVLFIALILESACLATLFFNRYPAKIFMGDTGALMLGAAIAILLIELGIPLWLPLLLIVCVFDVISVLLQVFSLKFFHKRIFKIAPFHHHLEKSGWKETTIVYTFWGVTLLFCFLAYLGTRGRI